MRVAWMSCYIWIFWNVVIMVMGVSVGHTELVFKAGAWILGCRYLLIPFIEHRDGDDERGHL